MSNYTEITLNLGETWTLEAIINHRDITNLDGCQIFWRLASQQATALEVSLGQGITVLDTAERRCRIVVPTQLQRSSNIKFGAYKHELMVQLPNGATSIQVDGPVTIKQSLSSKYSW